jgi:hypothetical protein
VRTLLMFHMVHLLLLLVQCCSMMLCSHTLMLHAVACSFCQLRCKQ